MFITCCMLRVDAHILLYFGLLLFCFYFLHFTSFAPLSFTFWHCMCSSSCNSLWGINPVHSNILLRSPIKPYSLILSWSNHMTAAISVLSATSVSAPSASSASSSPSFFSAPSALLSASSPSAPTVYTISTVSTVSTVSAVYSEVLPPSLMVFFCKPSQGSVHYVLPCARLQSYMGPGHSQVGAHAINHVNKSQPRTGLNKLSANKHINI